MRIHLLDRLSTGISSQPISALYSPSRPALKVLSSFLAEFFSDELSLTVLRAVVAVSLANESAQHSPNALSQDSHRPHLQTRLRHSRGLHARVLLSVCSTVDLTASLQFFFRKVSQIAWKRLQDLCDALSVLPRVTQQVCLSVILLRNSLLTVAVQMWNAFVHILVEYTALMKNRHLDQILLCTVYSVCLSLAFIAMFPHSLTNSFRWRESISVTLRSSKFSTSIAFSLR